MLKITTYFYLSEDAPLSFKSHIERLYPIFEKLSSLDNLAKDFLLIRETEAECYLYPVYENNGTLTKAAEAVLETEHKNAKTRAADWQNSDEKDPKKWISAGYMYGSVAQPNTFDIHFNGQHRFKDTNAMACLFEIIAKVLKPNVISIRSSKSTNIFPDRHGVNWMMYLPSVFTAQQIPEARALVPVMSNDKKPVRLGTIVVSVLNELFSDDNPEHVKIAHDIETRMVSEDLLPTFKQLRVRPPWLDK